MDTTKENIKMCEKAVEIQDLRPQAPTALSGNFIYSKEKNRVVVLYMNEHHGWPPMHYRSHNTSVWLPRQDQLQEMVRDNISSYMGLAITFARQIVHTDFDRLAFASMEQLWLAFVMKELYQKRWNGEDWIKQ